MSVVIVLVAAGVLTLGAYLGLERLGKAAALPAALRFVAWSILGLLVLDLSCARPPEAVRPVALLDASLSMGAAGGPWDAARREAATLGEVRLVGSLHADSTPAGGRSAMGPALAAAAASGRPVWLVTDGELEDGAGLPAELLQQVGVKVIRRTARPDLALTRVAGPDRIAIGDTLRLDVDVSGFDLADRKTAIVDVSAGSTRWLSRTIALEQGSGTATIEGPLPAGVAPGAHLLTVSVRDPNDAEPRTDQRLHALVVLPTPGIVVVAAPASWESRFLFRALDDVADLPVRGYFSLDGSRWSRMGDPAPVSAAEVEQAVGRADLLVQFGDPPDRVRSNRPRARWTWPATSRTSPGVEGDWYLVAGGASPVAGAFIGLPVDSFPPASGLVALNPTGRDWVGLSGQLNRRGVERPAILGRDSAGRREVMVGVSGLWRWAFRGGASEQAYRAWVAATTSWLLAASDSTTGRARPVHAVVQQGRPVVFERLRPELTTLRIDLRGGDSSRVDTLRFDGAGRATLALPPGRWSYRLEGGGAGLLGVEVYSDEWLPRPVTVADRSPVTAAPAGRAPLRDRLWLFGLAILALSGEWWWRRRSGLR
ncbi:MAG: hypothetical protein SFV24_06790 [Gemmatimonadales bacterium]|nr:hypothetical protein [Gemmatimonadales bacterium]